ncbi:MAG: glucokinase [Hyphomonadaceae bacterium]|nr:glucokinase [Hyphomonadaceae bacterium]
MDGASGISEEVLVADVGGTNCRLALGKVVGGNFALSRRKVYATGEQGDLADVVRDFLGADGRPTYAAFAVAGPVDGDTIALTNAQWRFSLAAMEHTFGFRRAIAVNDLVAQAEAAIRLTPADIAMIGDQALPARARTAIIGVGTGLGLASVSYSGGTATIVPTEGGHSGFAPFDTLDVEVMEQWLPETGRVVAEHVVSGPGLVRLHNTLRTLRNQRPEPGLDGREIVRRAFELEDGPCLETVHRFSLALASVCANFALVQGAEAIILVGDIVNSLLPELRSDAFRARFEQYGPRRGFLSGVPIGVATGRDLGLIGAYHHLQRALQAGERKQPISHAV